MTYIVRPFIEPRYRLDMRARISAGSIQWFVGPASACSREQMKVRSSTRATSLGSEAHQKLSSFFASRVNVPDATRASVMRVFSAADPFTQWTALGVVSSAISETHAASCAWVVGWPGSFTTDLVSTLVT